MSRKFDCLKAVTNHMNRAKNFEQHIKRINYISLCDGKSKTEFVINENDINKEGYFHKGLITTLVDILSGHALLSYGESYSGVSTNIHVRFLQHELPPGEIISIDTKVSKVLFPLAFVDVKLSKKNGGDIVANGQHTLFIKPFDEIKLKQLLFNTE